MPKEKWSSLWRVILIRKGAIEMEAVQIKLSGLWVALMLTYLLGDVLRIFSGDFKPGEIGGMKVTQAMWLGIAVLMLIPIVIVVLSLTLPHQANRWVNIIVAIFFFVFNLSGLHGTGLTNQYKAALFERSK